MTKLITINQNKHSAQQPRTSIELQALVRIGKDMNQWISNTQPHDTYQRKDNIDCSVDNSVKHVTIMVYSAQR